MSMTVKQLKQQFLEYIEIERGRSLRTVQNYDHYLTVFFDQTKVTQVGGINDEVVRNFRLWLNRQSGVRVRGQSSATMKKKTQNYYLIALRSFLKYARKRGVTTLSPDAIELAKVGERHLDLINTAELVRLMNAPDRETLRGLRDKAILELFFSTGLRVAELTTLNRDLDISRDELTIRGKGDKVRLVFLSPDAKDAIKAYLAKRADVHEALFIELSPRSASKNDGARLTPRSIERIVKQYAIAAGISRRVTPHVLRHAFATNLLENGADIRSVQVLLGHANIGTTQIYTHVTDKQLRDVHRKFHKKH
jgi:site-specific recombinase XerD